MCPRSNYLVTLTFYFQYANLVKLLAAGDELFYYLFSFTNISCLSSGNKLNFFRTKVPPIKLWITTFKQNMVFGKGVYSFNGEN